MDGAHPADTGRPLLPAPLQNGLHELQDPLRAGEASAGARSRDRRSLHFSGPRCRGPGSATVHSWVPPTSSAEGGRAMSSLTRLLFPPQFMARTLRTCRLRGGRSGLFARRLGPIQFMANFK
ncbi:unnamed protein product [Discosporangium mesarthrocarpum]